MSLDFQMDPNEPALTEEERADILYPDEPWTLGDMYDAMALVTDALHMAARKRDVPDQPHVPNENFILNLFIGTLAPVLAHLPREVVVSWIRRLGQSVASYQTQIESPEDLMEALLRSRRQTPHYDA